MDNYSETKKVWVVVPAYNEEQVIGEVIAELVACFDHVVVVDDCSTDHTGERALAAGAVTLRHVVNLGQGAALQTGIDYALVQGAEFVATFDADGQHRPADLVAMLERLTETGADVALGSRFLGSAPGISPLRRMVLRAATVFQTATAGARLTDAHNGLRMFRRHAVEKIQIRQNRMAHASEIVSQISQLGLCMIEVPCVIRYTEYSLQKGQNLAGAFRILLDLAIRKLYK